MKVLLTGAGGQLGQALLAAAPDNVELISTTRQELDPVSYTHLTLPTNREV